MNILIFTPLSFSKAINGIWSFFFWVNVGDKSRWQTELLNLWEECYQWKFKSGISLISPLRKTFAIPTYASLSGLSIVTVSFICCLQLSWFSIDGEPFEAKSITISLLPNKLHFFFIPNKTQHSWDNILLMANPWDMWHWIKNTEWLPFNKVYY